MVLDNFSRLSPTNFYVVNGDHLEIYTSLGDTFALIDLNGAVLFKTRIKKGVTTLKGAGKRSGQALDCNAQREDAKPLKFLPRRTPQKLS